MYTVKIQQWSSILDVAKGTILDAALAKGIPYPHSCRSGECGHCKTRLLVGEVSEDPCLKQALSDEERSQGYILACRAHPKSHLDIAWNSDIDATEAHPVRHLRARVMELQQVSAGVSRLRLEVQGEPLAFNAGQYVRLSVGGLPPRSYSMANRIDDPCLEFYVRHIPDGLVSGYIASELKAGDEVKLEGPFGSAYLRRKHGGAIIAAGSGTGLAPVLSIVRTALAHMPKRPVHLYFGVRSEADIYARETLTELAAAHPQLSMHIVLSQPQETTGSYRNGHIQQAMAQDLSDIGGSKVYVCGAPAMVNAVTVTAITHGLDKNDVHSDPFIPSADVQPAGHTDDSLLNKIGKLFKLKTQFHSKARSEARSEAFSGARPGNPAPLTSAASGPVAAGPVAAPSPAAGVAKRPAVPARLISSAAAEDIAPPSLPPANRLLPSCLTHARSFDELMPWLYLNGVPLSNARQLKTQWQREYAVWNQQTFSAKRYLYWWADGIYPMTGDAKDQPCVLLLAGVTEHGQTEFIACADGDRHAAHGWQELLNSVQQRGLTTDPRLVIGDRSLGLWEALGQTCKTAQQQYCWHYETRHALQELDGVLHKPMRAAMRAVWTAPIRLQAEQALYEFLLQYWEHSPKLAERLEHDQNGLLQFYDFPNAQRRYLHSADFIRSAFAGVQKQGSVAGGIGADMWPVLFYQLAISAEKRWPRLRGFNHLAHIKSPSIAEQTQDQKQAQAARAAA